MKFVRTIIFVCSLSIIGCATSNRQGELDKTLSGQSVRGLSFTCQLQNGDVVVTTDSKIANDASIKKAKVFIEKTEYQPINLSDFGLMMKKSPKNDLKFLEETVVDQLNEKTKNWTLNEKGTIQLEAEANTSLPTNERMIQFVRTKTQSKTICYAKDVFPRITGAKVVEGATVRMNTGILGKVTAIGENEVTVEFKPESNQPIDGPYGPISVTDRGDHYSVEVDVRDGNLVRVGPAVGRISTVNDKNFLIDYSHPFGGQTLSCDVSITAIQKETTPTSKADAVASIKEAVIDTYEDENTINGIKIISDTTPSSTKLSAVIAATGDMATVAYTASLESGEVVRTTSYELANDPGTKMIEGYQTPEAIGPQTIIIGASGDDPLTVVGEACQGMAQGARRKVVVPASKAFGLRNAKLMRNFDRTKVFPTQITLKADEYVKQFGSFPIANKTVNYNSYIEGRIVEVSEKGALLKLTPTKETFDEDFGKASATVSGSKIEIFLTPKMGAAFDLDNRHGRVVAVDYSQFTVDFNDPLAGEKMVLDLELQSLTKADQLAGMEIHWIEDYDQGLEQAKRENKPAVLLLYADWCHFCKKMQSETLTDPRIKMMSDDFVWIKVNSDKNREYKEMYEQNGFPLTVVIDGSGEVLNSINGFRPASEFINELEKVNGKGSAQKSMLKASKVETKKS